jgi:hypothetical protein
MIAGPECLLLKNRISSADAGSREPALYLKLHGLSIVFGTIPQKDILPMIWQVFESNPFLHDFRRPGKQDEGHLQSCRKLLRRRLTHM